MKENEVAFNSEQLREHETTYIELAQNFHLFGARC